MKWWDEFDDTYKMGVLLSVVAIVGGIVACWVQPASEDRLVTHEVTLGDGTRATCVVVQGVRRDPLSEPCPIRGREICTR